MRAQTHRAARLEWEHVVPAHNFGMARRCWQEGGRSHCQKTDPLFGRMEADLHNLVPAVGEINADRSNYRFGMLPDAEAQHGGCDFRVNFKRRVVEPRDAVKGQVARIYLYMHQRYYLPMSESQRRLFQAWHTRFPVTDWERERDRRIKAITGVSNPFVVGSDAQSQSQSPVPVAHE
jgi:deoxyribonuclease-1